MDSEALANWSTEEVALDLADALFMTTNDTGDNDLLSYVPAPPQGSTLRLWLRSTKTGERRLFKLTVTELACSPRAVIPPTP